ncbi:MAG: OmpH family outer membrane protein [Bacteroidia bacterium]
MKNTMKRIAVLALAITISTAIQAQKMAHIGLDSLISLMPETKKAQEIAQDYLKQLEKEVASMKAEFDGKYNDYLANEATYSELIKKKKQEELQDLNQRIEEFRTQAQQDYQKKYGELSKPIYEKAKKGIDAVAKEGGYKYVFDTSTGVVIYSEPSDDILPTVKKKLESMPEAVLPGANNSTNTPPKNTPPNKGGTPPKK